MLRLLALTALTGAMSFAPASRAAAEVCLSGPEASVGELGSLPPVSEEAPRATPAAEPTRSPSGGSREPLAWCETPDDPQCAPASAPSEGPQAEAAPPATLAPLAAIAPPRARASARPRFAEQRPRDAARSLPYRPPR